MKNFPTKKKLLIPVIALSLVLVSSLSGCIASAFSVRTWDWGYPESDSTGTSVILSGQLIVSQNSKNWVQGFAWDTTNHANYKDYTNQVEATGYHALGFFTVMIDNLERGTEYHYRAFGESKFGDSSQGIDNSFIAGTPICKSGIAKDIGLTSCKFTGTLAHLGGADECSVWFEYGLEENNLNFRAPEEDLIMDNTGTFEVLVENLEECTTYYWRAVAQNDVSKSQELFFGMPVIYSVEIGVPQVNTVRATNIGAQSATLKGELLTLAGAESCEVWFKYGDQSPKNLQYETPPITMTENGDFSIPVNGLKPGTTYWFRAYADNGHCSDIADDVYSFTTADTIGGSGSSDDGQTRNVGGIIKTIIYNRILNFIDEDMLLELAKYYPQLQRILSRLR